MNILPKKRWHVRTKDNIARVRKDQAQAAEEEKERVRRIETAEREARTEHLRNKAKELYGNSIKSKKEEVKEEETAFPANKHVNLFYELDTHSIVSNKTNKEHEEEKKQEKEKYEKQIGYLTYLGQDTNELTGNVSWYNKLPEKHAETEVGMKEKALADPLKDIRKYLGTKGVQDIKKQELTKSMDVPKQKKKKDKHKKSKKKEKHKRKKRRQSSSGDINESRDKSSSEKRRSDRKEKKRKRRSTSSSEEEPPVKKANVEKLRLERLRREANEGLRAKLHLAKLRGELPEVRVEEPTVVQKYSSQFNPHLANQNFKP